MTEIIEEIALDTQEALEDNTEQQEVLHDSSLRLRTEGAITAEVGEVELEPEPSPKAKAKCRGRPKGSPNKGPAKPRAKKVTVRQAPVEDASLPYEPTSPKRNLRLPTSASNNEVAAAMLSLLQEQTFSRQARRQRQHNSWFQ